MKFKFTKILSVALLAMLAACGPQKVSDEQLEKAIAKYISENPQDAQTILLCVYHALSAKG